MKVQFASILKGLRNNFGFLPFLNGLYLNKIYVRNFKKAEAFYAEYNEYTKEEISSNEETVNWLLVKYDISHEEALELEYELRFGFPVCLKSNAAYKMIASDWGPENNSRLLSVTENVSRSSFRVVCLAFLEECFRWFSPILVSLLIGLLESLENRSLYSFFAHLFLGFIMLDFGFWFSVVVHVCHNLLLVSAGPKLSFIDMVSKRKSAKTKSALLNDIAALKGQMRNKKKKSGSGKRGRRNPYAQMLNNPCDATLEAGFYGTTEGILNSLKTVLFPSSSFTNGYIIWDATYTGDVGSNHANCVIYTNADSSIKPLNTVADPFGGGATDVSPRGQALDVGASDWGRSSIVSDTRCIGACLRMTYFGPMNVVAGQIAIIENLSADSLLSNGSPASIDDLFAVSSIVKRLGVDPYEVKFRPNNNSPTFKTDRDSPITTGTGLGVVSGLSSEALRFSPRFVGFAWRNITSASDLNFEFYQNVEWRPNTTSGFVATVPKQIKSNDSFQSLLKYLDDNFPGWQHTVSKMAAGQVSGVAARIARMAFTGT
jgi:hypothetical protein